MDDSDQRLTRIEVQLAKLEAGQAKLEDSMTKLQAGHARLEIRLDNVEAILADVKRLLETLVPVIIRIDERLAHQPSPSEFYELRGRVEELSLRMNDPRTQWVLYQMDATSARS